MRASLPMNIKARIKSFKVWSKAQLDIDRVIAIWQVASCYLQRPLLIWQKTQPCRCDVCPRCAGAVYDLTELRSTNLVSRIASISWLCREMKQWIADAMAAESDDIEELEVEF
jgi:glutathione S-transferase